MGIEASAHGSVELTHHIIIKGAGASVGNPTPGTNEHGYDFDRSAGILRVLHSEQRKQSIYKHWFIRYDEPGQLWNAKKKIDDWYVQTARELRLPMGWSTDEVWTLAIENTPQQYNGVVFNVPVNTAANIGDIVPHPTVRAGLKKKFYKGRLIEYYTNEELEAAKARYDRADSSYNPITHTEL